MTTGDLGDVIDDLNVLPSKGFEPIPPGKYKATVVKAEVKTTKDGSGKYLEVVEQLWDDEYAGRQLIARFNIVNRSEKAQAIGRGQLSALAQACGLPSGIPRDSNALFEKPHLIKVVIVPGDGMDADGNPYGPKNEVKGWYAIGGTKAQAPAANGKPGDKSAISDDDLPSFML